jgi:hypothetical protein
VDGHRFTPGLQRARIDHRESDVDGAVNALHVEVDRCLPAASKK